MEQNKGRSRARRIVIILLAAVMLISGGLSLHSYLEDKRAQEEYERLAELARETTAPVETETPVFYQPDMEFEIGKGITVREGGDVTIITTGTVLHKAIQAADLLGAEGIRATVVDMHTIKPIDRNLVIECAGRTGAIVTVEEHSIYGGLGSAVAEVLAEHMPVPMERIGAVDFAESGDYEALLAKYGYSPEAIADKCRAVMKRR